MNIDVPVIATSVENDKGIEELQKLIREFVTDP